MKRCTNQKNQYPLWEAIEADVIKGEVDQVIEEETIIEVAEQTIIEGEDDDNWTLNDDL